MDLSNGAAAYKTGCNVTSKASWRQGMHITFQRHVDNEHAPASEVYPRVTPDKICSVIKPKTGPELRLHRRSEIFLRLHHRSELCDASFLERGVSTPVLVTCPGISSTSLSLFSSSRFHLRCTSKPAPLLTVAGQKLVIGSHRVRTTVATRFVLRGLRHPEKKNSLHQLTRTTAN